MLTLLTVVLLGADPAPKVSISGFVKDAHGRPVAKAIVIIHAAVPLKAVGVLCPSCYPDCAKTAVTDASGWFILDDLDPTLPFQLLAFAEGFAPNLPIHARSDAGPANLILKPHDLDARDPALVFRGRVLNEDGTPVPWAVVEPLGFQAGDRSQFGKLKGIDPLALTNAKGEFRIGLPEKGIDLSLRVSAPFLARRNFGKLSSDRAHDLTLGRGVTVRGRLVKGVMPVPRAAVGVVQKDRGMERFVGEYWAAADDKGVFRIPNVPPSDDFSVYGLMDSLKAHGAIAARPLKTGGTGTEVDVGDLEVKPGFSLAGRLVLSDSKRVPARTRVTLSREEAWDSQQMVVADDGSFTFNGLPGERYSLSANVKGYVASPKNASYEMLNGFGLCGRVASDIEGLQLLLDAGERPKSPDFNKDPKMYEEYKRRQDAPLRGAEVRP